MENNYYLEFENKFRGDRNTIIDRLSMYDPLVEIIVKNNPSPKLIDIGCGRGEWIEKWKYRFDDICGIESDQKMIDICRENNLNVKHGDAIAILSSLENQTVDVITIFHMIEHIEYKKLLKLLNECLRVLTNDGILLIETPNIDSLLVSSKSFYIDPTHINPIHPDLISFDMEKIGFSNIKTYNISSGPLKNANHLKITRILNGVAQDLFIVATKREETFEMLMLKLSSWETSLDIGITTLEAAVEHDIKLEQLLDSEKESNSNIKSIIESQASKLDKLENEIYLLRSQLKILIYLFKTVKIFFKPIIILLKLSRKFVLILCNNCFNVL